MYWYNRILRYGTIGLFALLTTVYGCKPNVRQSNGNLKYFSLTEYFKDEAARLSKQAKPVLKTASYNGKAETKSIFIKNWVRELDLFSGSDINKAAWKDSYKIDKNADSIVYAAIDTNLHTRLIAIRLKAGKVTGVIIHNFTKNMLYQTSEKLMYYPDSVYYIEKRQYVKFMGVNTYKITGKF